MNTAEQDLLQEFKELIRELGEEVARESLVPAFGELVQEWGEVLKERCKQLEILLEDAVRISGVLLDEEMRKELKDFCAKLAGVEWRNYPEEIRKKGEEVLWKFNQLFKGWESKVNELIGENLNLKEEIATLRALSRGAFAEISQVKADVEAVRDYAARGELEYKKELKNALKEIKEEFARAQEAVVKAYGEQAEREYRLEQEVKAVYAELRRREEELASLKQELQDINKRLYSGLQKIMLAGAGAAGFIIVWLVWQLVGKGG